MMCLAEAFGRRGGLAALLVGTALSSGSAWAQSAASASQGSVLEELVVTAQKRSENLQDVPATVSVVGSEAISQFHVTQLTDIGAYVPGLQVDSGGTPGQTTLSIRGIAPLSPNATVATYLDDTPIGATSYHDRGSSYALDILPYDVARIEVLEGPQGTLYGANALGGIVKYVLTTPNLDKTQIRVGGDAFGISGAGEAGGGARAMINTALVPGTLGLIASYAYEATPGFIDNRQTGEKDQNASRQQGGRLALLWQASPDLSLKLGAIYQRTEADGNASIALDPVRLTPLLGRQVDNNYLPNTFRSDLKYYMADLNWDLHWVKLVSATSWSDQKIAAITDATRTYQPIYALFGSPDGLSSFPLRLQTKKFTQELRLASPADVKLEWLVGAYYDHEEGTNTQALTAQHPDKSSIAGLDPAFQASLPTDYKEYAVFANLTYHFTDRFDVAGGVRYAKNDQVFRQIIQPGPIVPASNQLGTSSEGVWTYSVSPRFHVTKDLMTYVRVASGYQAGGPNLAFPGVPPSVASSTLTNYELGVKAEFWEHRALLNVSIFDLEWKDIQVSATAPAGVTYSTNGGTARSRGLQADGAVRPMEGLQLAATATYTDATLTQDIPSVGGLSGDRLPLIPKWSGSLRADYNWAVDGDWNGHVGAGLRMVGARFSSGPNLINEYPTKGYSALDLNADLSNDRYTIRLFVKNLTDTRATLTAFAVQNGLTGAVPQVEGSILQPRTVGVALDVTF